MMVGGAEIRLEHSLKLSRDGASHQHQRIDREKRILPELCDVMAANEPLGLKRLVFGLVLDPAQRLGRRQIVGRLVDPAKQHRNVFELDAGAAFDAWKGEFRQISIRAAEIELEFNFQGTYHRPLLGITRYVVSDPATTSPVLATNCSYSSKNELSIVPRLG